MTCCLGRKRKSPHLLKSRLLSHFRGSDSENLPARVSGFLFMVSSASHVVSHHDTICPEVLQPSVLPLVLLPCRLCF
ncbi:rCG57821 [Rattus norvegicus]|uniref:RCG57821 n=1 Tax=Rattus norvegicus TaxID=10116 RepID=A6J436_RAT|nr:rCG57821 [Rattus norvegicus]